LIKTIEIICKPCHKCELLKERIHNIIQYMELQKRIKIRYEFNHNTNVLDASKYGYAINQLPLVIINGNIEFVGHVKEEYLIRIKLEEINREY